MLCIIVSFLSACNSYKNVPYFQNLKRNGTVKEAITNFSPLVIQPEDLLTVNVTSLNPGAWQDSSSKAEYQVSQEGTIQLPILNEVKVAGFTASQLQDQLKRQLTKYLKNPNVNVRIVNYKVAVLGDVLRPDVFKIPNTRVTLLEALSLAGDLTITAKRTNVLIIREVNGEREYQTVDLTSTDFIKSPAYYLKNNDVVYVQPDKTKFATVDPGYRTLSLVLSGLSIVAIVLANVLN